VGSVGEALFYAALALLGAGGVWLLFRSMILPEWRANVHFERAECEVLARRLVAEPQRAEKARPEPAGNSGAAHRWRPEFLVRYHVDGRPYEVWSYDIHHGFSEDLQAQRDVLQQFDVGRTCPCWYDPGSVENVVLVRSYTWWRWLMLLVPFSFVLIGAVGFSLSALQSGTSPERRAALVRNAARLEKLEEEEEADDDEQPHQYPLVPSITNSPGTQLAYRLPVDTSASWNLLGMILMCLLWNGITGWFLLAGIRDHLASRGSWWTMALLLPFALGGVALVGYVCWQMLEVVRLGTTRLEISDHPLLPGEQCEVHLSHTNASRIDRLELRLMCEEVVTYRQGTDTRIERRRVVETPIVTRAAAHGPSGKWAEHCRFQVPPMAMHSFQAMHNEIRWFFCVDARDSRGRRWQRDFPVIVGPPSHSFEDDE